MIYQKNEGKLKMTVCIESYKGNGNYCEIEITEGYTNIVYVVSVCPIIDDLLVGYPIKKATYPISEKKKAMATYRRYIKTYCKEAVEKSIYGIIEEIHKEKI